MLAELLLGVCLLFESRCMYMYTLKGRYNKDTSAGTGQAGIRTHILITPELECTRPLSHDTPYRPTIKYPQEYVQYY